MKKIILLAAVLFTVIVSAQTASDKITDELKYAVHNSVDEEKLLVWIFFTDKGEDTESYFANPLSVVSEKSLTRRAKVLDKNSLISSIDLPVNQNYISVLEQSGFNAKQRSRWFNGVSGYATKQMIEQLSSIHFVKRIDVVYKFKSINDVSESDETNTIESHDIPMTKKGNVMLDYGQSFTQLNQITVPDVHNLGFTGEGITICLMDAGFDRLSHQVFSSMNIIAAWDFVNGDPNVQNHGDLGSGSHGTSTLSTIGGFYEGQLIGPAYNANYVLAKTENTETETPIEEDKWIAALEWADSIGVDITSTSLGYLDFDPPFPSYTWEDMDGNTARITIGADLAVSLGIFVVNSAGNSGFDVHNTLGAPADGDSVVAIGAVTSGGSRSNFSSVGPTVDGRIKPDLMAMGSQVYVARNTSNTSYGTSNGTSFSCPLAAGAAALVLEADPTLTPMELLQVMKTFSSRSSNPDNLMGWGIINTYAAVQSVVTSNDDKNIPADFYLLRNYPNPFNPSTRIQFAVPEKSIVKLTLNDVLGREIQVLLNEEVNPGLNEYIFNSGNLSSGVYFVRMVAEEFTKTLKINLIK